MRAFKSVSVIAIIVALSANPAFSQSQANIDAINLIRGFSLLSSTEAGRSVLFNSLETSIGINNNSSAAERALAVSDNTTAALIGSMSNGLVTSDALGSKMGSAFAAINSINPKTYQATTFSSSFEQFFSQVNALIQSDSSIAKNYYANGSRNGNPAQPAIGLTLPPGGVFNVYDIAYNPLPANKNTVGNSRPVQVAPDRIQTFTAPDFFGVSTNTATGIVPSLKGNAAFPSGHSAYGFASTLMFAQMVPERFQEMLTRGSEYGNNRVVLGAHHALDVIGARIMTTYTLAQILNNNPAYLNQQTTSILGSPITTTGDFQSLFTAAQTDLRAALEAGCGASIESCAASSDSDRLSDKAKNKADYTYRLTYGLPAVGPTDLPPVVPVGAEVLIATRFPYLNADQRREVLATTEIASGQPLDDGSGWARLNLYAAADGYGAFNGDVTVMMDASKGGFNAFDSWGNDIGGSGGLIKTGTGALELTGNNSFSGGLRIEDGVLIGHAGGLGLGNIVDNASLVIEQAGDATLASAISGHGDLWKTGEGALTLTGTSTLSGATSVLAGRLTVDGRLDGSIVSVEDGGVLGGNGTVGGIVARGGANIAPGNSIGTLKVAGDVAFQAGSRFTVEVNAAGQSDRIEATGSASLSGGSVQVLAENGLYDWQAVYPILTASGGVSGQFADVSSNFDFLVPTLTYDPTRVSLTLTRNDVSFADVALTRNQLGVANAVTAAGYGSPLYGAVVQTTREGARAAFDALSGEIHATTGSVMIERSGDVRRAVLDRLWQESDASLALPPAPQLSAGAGPVKSVEPPPSAPSSAFWAEGFGSWGKIEASGGAMGVDTSTGGFLLGADAPVDDTWRFGLAGGYSRTSVDGEGSAGTAMIDSYTAALYGSGQWGPAALRLGAAYTLNQVDTSRQILIGAFGDQPDADYDARTAQVFGEFGYRLNIGSVALEPFAGLAYVNLDTDSFVEFGGPAALHGRDGSQSVTFSTLGLRLANTFDLGGTAITAHGMVGWRHAFGDVDPSMTMAFAGSSLPFSVTGLPVARDAVAVEAGLDITVAKDVTLGVSYLGQYGDSVQDSALKGNLVWKF